MYRLTEKYKLKILNKAAWNFEKNNLKDLITFIERPKSSQSIHFNNSLKLDDI